MARALTTTTAPDESLRVCARCRYFSNDVATLEKALPGIYSLSSPRGSTRGDDGICLKHDRYLSSHATCAAFAPAGDAEFSG